MVSILNIPVKLVSFIRKTMSSDPEEESQVGENNTSSNGGENSDEEALTPEVEHNTGAVGQSTEGVEQNTERVGHNTEGVEPRTGDRQSTEGSGQSTEGVEQRTGDGQSTEVEQHNTGAVGQSTEGVGQSLEGVEQMTGDGQSTGFEQNTEEVGQGTEGVRQSIERIRQSTGGAGQSTEGVGQNIEVEHNTGAVEQRLGGVEQNTGDGQSTGVEQNAGVEQDIGGVRQSTDGFGQNIEVEHNTGTVGQSMERVEQRTEVDGQSTEIEHNTGAVGESTERAGQSIEVEQNIGRLEPITGDGESADAEHNRGADGQRMEGVGQSTEVEHNTEAVGHTESTEQRREVDGQSIEDEAIPSKLGESLKYALECPVCLEYMLPPIIMCKSGHNVCKECRPYMSLCPTCREPLTATRNVALENLAREILKPPPNRELVTPLPISNVELDASEYESIHSCPLECSWIGRRSGMRVHMLGYHKDKFLDGNEHNKCQWKMPLIVRDVRIIFAFDEVFRYRLRLHTIKKTFYIAVQYIGPPTEAHKFKYEVEISGDNKVIVMGNPMLEEAVDMDAVFESGNCVTLDYELVKSVDQLVYSIKLLRSAT